MKCCLKQFLDYVGLLVNAAKILQEACPLHVEWAWKLDECHDMLMQGMKWKDLPP